MTTTDLLSTDGRHQALSVSQLNRQARRILETHLPLIWVEGELSNIAQPSSGHWYFTLKDDRAQVRCAMFKNRNQAVRFNPEQGQQLLARARVSIYEGRGDYQLIVEHLEEAGFGALQRAYEALKRKLDAEGLFDPARKRPLPALPRHIGVITSGTGAALRDFLSVLKRRFAGIEVTVIAVPVQGQASAPAIVQALALANRAELFDVLVLTRGGGSLEDLWPFNEEAVARAIAESALPVVSAVGHEVDFTIADFVADLRAPTPSAAAEQLAPDGGEWLAGLAAHQRRLVAGMQRQLGRASERLHALQSRLRHPGERLQQQSQRLDGLELRLHRAAQQPLVLRREKLNSLAARLRPLQPGRRIADSRQQVARLNAQLQRAVQQQLQGQRQRLGEASRLLDTVSPLNTLQRGYAIVHDEQGQIVRRADQLSEGERVRTRLASGELDCRVEKVR